MHQSTSDSGTGLVSSAPYYRRWPGGAPVRQAVVGRTPAGSASRTAESREIPALLELSDNSVWAIRIPFDVVDTESGFTRVAAVLVGREDIPSARARLSEDISFELDFRVSLASPAIDLASSEAFWKVRTTAIAEVLGRQGALDGDTGRLVAQKEAEIRVAVAEVLTPTEN